LTRPGPGGAAAGPRRECSGVQDQGPRPPPLRPRNGPRRTSPKAAAPQDRPGRARGPACTTLRWTPLCLDHLEPARDRDPWTRRYAVVHDWEPSGQRDTWSPVAGTHAHAVHRRAGEPWHRQQVAD